MKLIKLKWLALGFLVVTAGLTALKARAIVDPFERQTLDDLSFSQLPPVDTSGEVEVPNGPTIRWERGQSPADYLPLGVIIDSLGVGEMTLSDIGDITGLNPGDVTLDRLELIEWQTIQNLVDGVPQLGDYKVADVQPIADVLGDQYSDSLISELPEEALSQTLPVESLSVYSILDIPNLANTPLDQFDRAGWSTIYGVPGVEDIPLSQFPTAVQAPAWAKVDIVYGNKETTRKNTITGSTQEQSWSVPCEQPCAYLEVTNAHSESGNLSASDYHGKQYVAGDFQKVKGGWAGVETNWVGGREPTGQLPFGDLAKVSAAGLTEQKGTGQLRLNYRYCERSFGVTLACTPYGIQDGLLSQPLMPIQETGYIPVMALTETPAKEESSQPDQAEVDTSDPLLAEQGGNAPITGENIPVTGSSEQSSPPTTPSPEAEPEDCEYTGGALNTPVVGEITSAFGPRINPVTGEPQGLHNGTDFGAPHGASIGAAECGTVTFAGWFNDASGNVLIIDHGAGLVTQYLHICEGCFSVEVGSEIERGQGVAQVGTTGRSTGPHLHFMVRENGEAVNPEEFL